MNSNSSDRPEDLRGAASCPSDAADSIERRAALRAMAAAVALGLANGPSGRVGGDGSSRASAAELQDASKASEPAKNAAAARRFPANAGKYLSGELVYVDAVNRRGGIRLDGVHGRYFTGPPHWFALLPHAPVWHNGARAELRDLPLGTYVHGYFIEPPPGDEETIPVFPDDKKQFAMATNHATLLEDDFSFYQRRGQAWKVASLDLAKEKIRLEPIAVPSAATLNASAPNASAPTSSPANVPTGVPAKLPAGAPTSSQTPPPGAGAADRRSADAA
ncbi:MAG TPA: hypothetical protein PLV92_28060 [Pirellulaceae bacterium]|nr:hypothetical protein [Pirellulaceae bacterium]